MKRLIRLLAIIAFACGASSVRANEEGLVAHYNFDEGQGVVAKDVSGNGHEGKVSSGTKYVKHGDGFAMDFSGRTDTVDLGNAPGLMMKGDITIEAWVKTSNNTNEDQLILGDTAGLAVNRNYLLFNSKGILRFDHGNGTASESLTVDKPLFTGEWQHVAFVSEYPYYYFYLDGKMVKRGKMNFDITPTPGGARAIGGWWAGHFDGQLDDVKLYSKALSGNRIAAHAGTQRVGKPAIDITITPLWRDNALNIAVWADSVPTRHPKVRLSLQSPGASVPDIQEINASETRTGSGRASAVTTFKTAGLKKGEYQIRAALLGEGDTAVAVAEKKLQCGGRRSWIDSRIGITETVMPPWTPIRLRKQSDPEGNLKSLKVGVWGRDYVFEDSFFPASVTTRDKQILGAPILIAARVNGRDLSFKEARLRIEKSTPAIVIVTATGKAAGLTLNVRHQIEYDGFMKSEWRVDSGAKATLEGLSFEMPLVADHARYLYCSGYYERTQRAVNVGTLKEGLLARRYTPFLWLGDEDVGLQWVCESTQDWFNSDEEKALKIVKDSSRTTVQICLVDRPVEIGGGKYLHYTFGLQASPVKPVEQDCWDYRIVGATIVDYGKDYDLLTKQVDGQPVLDYYQKRGVKAVLLGNWTKILAYTSPTGHEQQLRDLVRECHKRGIKVMPYFGYQISELAPEWPEFGDNVMVLPNLKNPDRYPGEEPQMVDSVCLRSVWKNFLLETMAKLIDDYDIDGIYLDSTVMPFPCLNQAHGCGYLDSAGQVKPNYAIFDIRDFTKRLYTIVKSRKPDGIIDMHVYDGMNLPALTWGTSYWNGEQLPSATGDNYTEVLPLDRFRTDFMGRQWGVAADFLHYRLGNYRKSFALTLLHDVLVRPMGASREDLDLASSLWLLGERFGRKEANWLPYWRNADEVTVSPSGCYVSLYKHPRNGVLAVVSNLTLQETKVTAKLNLQLLGLTAAASARDALTNEPVPMQDGQFEMSLKPLSWKVIWLK